MQLLICVPGTLLRDTWPRGWSSTAMVCGCITSCTALTMDRRSCWSMGSRVGLQAVLDFPDRWRHAVLAGLGMRGAIDQSASIARALRGRKPENPVAQSFYSFASARPHNDLEALAACIEAPQPALDPARLHAIHTPILLVIGEHDELASGTDRLLERIPTARLVTVPGPDHLRPVPAREFKDAAL